MHETTAGDGTPTAGGYPAHWEVDAVLADGGTVQVRPIRPDDAPRIAEFHTRQSPESIYFRYFSPHPTLSDTELAHLTTVDYVDRMAFVALRDDVVVGIALYERWPTRAEAEVAFFVDETHRGRGVATLLLEYLAAAAREVGIGAFTASVLPSNRSMVRVFQAAGFETVSSFEEGVIAVRLDLRPTPEAEAAIADRAARAEAEAVKLLLAPRSVAVIGASRQRGAVGHAVLRNLIDREFAGPVYPVNRATSHVAGVPAFPSVDALPGPVDVAVICVPAAQVPSVIDECGRAGVRAAIVVSAGFAEAGPEGEALSAATVRTARRFGMRLLGPNCLGVVNTDPTVRLHATFAAPHPRPGRIALLSESGTIGGVVLEHMRAAGLGVSSFAAIGNRADVSGNDLLQYWGDDPRTEIVLLNLESFGNPRKFSRIARRLARAKPVVAVKSGREARAYPAEDADLPATTADALLRQSGVIRVDTLSQLLDVARVLAGQPLPRGNRVAIVGNAAGSLALVADACVAAGLTLAGSTPYPGGVRATTIPFDAGTDELVEAGRAALGNEAVDCVLVVCVPGPAQRLDDVVAALEVVFQDVSDKTIVACIYGPHPVAIAAHGDRAVPVFDFPDDAAYALGRVGQYARWRGEPEGAIVIPEGCRPGEARAVVDRALADRESAPLRLSTPDTLDVLAAVGIAAVPAREALDGDTAVLAASGLGYPVAVKSVRRGPMAKSEEAGVALDVHAEAELHAALRRMGAALGDALWPVVLQPMVPPGLDVMVSVTSNPLVGPVLTFGPGGVAARVAAAEVRVLPLTDVDATRLLAGASSVRPLLDDRSCRHVEDLLLRVGALVEEVAEIVSIELNPVIVSPELATVADATVRVASRERDPLPPIRRV